ncbi:AIPR family protein [Jannaschia sp. R86511]|uniref:AIPR family protein n=1 Tax=Jannaschia sp. R86511 TaxID=3093853 RepID=UPI0036D3C57E
MQVKDAKGFGEDAIDKMMINVPRLLVFDRNEKALSASVNSRLLEITRRFLATYQALEMPEMAVYVAFASLKAGQVHPNVVLKGNQLSQAIGHMLGECPVQVDFLDAAALCASARESRVTHRKLRLAENAISTDTSGGYVGVVRLEEYERFITTESGEIDSSLFEANVRDYEGETDVNRSIQLTLMTSEPGVDFWWLNNGVTIVAQEVRLANKLLELESPQIVNGLQTSTEIFKRKEGAAQSGDTRSVLVKVIEAKDAAIRERIIRATNSQTAFGPSVLRATDKVQREIEEFLLGRDLFYERRRRQHFNEGRPINQIVSIDAMGQAILSILAQKPHISRATLTEIFSADIYDSIFSPEYPVEMYAGAINIQRQCDDFLRRGMPPVWEDYRFQLSMAVAMRLTRRHQPSAAEVAAHADSSIDALLLSDSLEVVQAAFASVGAHKGLLLMDQIAKHANTTAEVQTAVRKRLAGTGRG